MLRATAPVYTMGIRAAHEYDPLLGVRLKKSYAAASVKDYREEIRTNRFGIVDFRDDYSAYPARIFALGDSYTQGTGLPLDAAYPAQLDLMLNSDSTGRYTPRSAVLNLGLGSYGGEQTFLTLQRFTQLLGAPSWCLYTGSDNDFDDDLLFRSGARHKHLVSGSPRFLGKAEWLGRLTDFQIGIRVRMLLADRRLRQLRRRALENDSTAALATSRASTAPPSGATPGPSQNVAEAEWPVLQRIVSACRQAGAEVVLSWVPSIDTSGYNWLRRKASEEGIPFNDWYPGVASTLEAIPGYPMANGHSGGHYRSWVSRRIALGFHALVTPRETPSSIPAAPFR